MKKEFDWFDHPHNITRLKRWFWIVLVLLVVADFFIHKHTLFYTIEKMPGFYAFFGFIACVAIILISKLLGYVLKRKEGYYDE